MLCAKVSYKIPSLVPILSQNNPSPTYTKVVISSETLGNSYKTKRRHPRVRINISWRHLRDNLMFIGPCIIVIVEERKTNLMSLAILFHVLCAQHVSDINISIIRRLRLLLNYHIRSENKTTDVVIQQYSRNLLMMDILMSETR
jgi:hypothetical protein